MAARRAVVSLAILAVFACSASARADGRRKPPPKGRLDPVEGPAPADAPPPPARQPAELDKIYDPANVTAISQALDTLVQANVKYAAKDYMAAIDLYRKGIALNPKNPLGPYLLGEAQLAAGNLAEADAAFKQAEELADSRNPALRSRVLFAVADVLERQKKWLDAEAAWRGYLEHAPKVQGGAAFPETAKARIDALVKIRELSASYEAVRARIAAEKAAPPAPPPSGTKKK